MFSPYSRVALALGFLLVLAGRPSALAAETDKPRLDTSGDPLPAEAVQRLGTLRFRTEIVARAAALSPDGKTIALFAPDGLVLIDSKSGKEIKRFANAGLVTSDNLSFTPTGMTIAAYGGQTVRLIDAESGKVRGELVAPTKGSINSISFSTDGKRIAVGFQSANGKQSVTVWDGEGFKELHTLEVLQTQYVGVALSGDGKRLATWGFERGADENKIGRTIQLWDTASGKEQKKIVVDGDAVFGAALSPDGKEMAVAEGSGATLNIWKVETGKVAHRLLARRGSGSILRYSPDGKMLVARTADGAVQLWETSGYTRLGMALAHDGGLSSIAFQPDGKVLALGTSKQALCLWEAPSGKVLSPREGHTCEVTTLRFTPDGTKVVSGGPDGVRVWNAATGKSERHLRLRGAEEEFLGRQFPEQFVLSPDGRNVLVGYTLGDTTQVVDLGNEQEQFGLDLDTSIHELKAVFSADGKKLAVIVPLRDRTSSVGVRVWNLASGREEVLVTIADDHPAIALSSDGKLLLTATTAEGRAPGGATPASKLKLWEVATGKERWTATREKQGTTNLAFSPNGLLIAAVSETGVCLFDAATGAELRPFENGETIQPTCVMFSPDGRSLAVGGYRATDDKRTGIVCLWETASGKLRVEFTGHRDLVSELAFSPDGRVLASASYDTTILLWDLTGKLNAAVRNAAKPKQVEFDALWNDLNDSDGTKSYRLVQLLAAHPAEAVALVKAKLPPAKGKSLDAAEIAKMITQLDHDHFEHREQASKVLAEAGKAIAPALTKALAEKPSPEKKRRLMELLDALKASGPSLEMVRPTRALEVLERLGTPEARQVLEDLAKGQPEAKLTEDAKATLKRLGSSAP